MGSPVLEVPLYIHIHVESLIEENVKIGCSAHYKFSSASCSAQE